jgi:hypothetical protein
MSIRYSIAVVLTLVTVTPAAAQFRRGLGESKEVTLFPIEPPALLLPSNSTVEVTVRNGSSASARIVERLKELFTRQLTDNDTRVRLADKSGDILVTATLTEWTESRRNSTKYVSETRQVGTREVTDSKGKKKTEAVYEYGRNRPSVVIAGNAGIRVEVKRRGTTLADETARYTISEEHVADQNPPSRDAVEDMLIDNVVRRAAGRITPGRVPVRVLLARSDDVDKLNDLALDRKWQDWQAALDTVKPHRDRKRDAYRIHNLAVAQESAGYESEAVEDALIRLGRAADLIAQATSQHPDEKYITESAARISRSLASYRQVAHLQQQMNTRAVTEPPPSAAASRTPAAKASAAADALTNDAIIELRAAGLDDDNLIASIKSAKAVDFDLSPAGLKALLQGKISNRVITAMRARGK